MNQTALPQHRAHPRDFETNRFVYPVLSRRSHGLSVGINLNPDKICNFDCIYCQVDRRSAAVTRFVETEQLLTELGSMLDWIISGEVWEHSKFDSVPPQLRRLNDLAFSGDGEPTTYRNFDEIVAEVAAMKRARGLDDVRLVLITNASMFHRPVVQQGLRILDENQGQIWAKLEAGTAEYFKLVDRTPIPFPLIVANITAAARVRPIVLQSLFMRVNDEPPPEAEIGEFIQRLREVTAAGGQIDHVQIYTIARQPAESYAAPLADAEVDAIAERVAAESGLKTERYYGCS